MSEKREFTGVFIPAHIWESKELTPNEKYVIFDLYYSHTKANMKAESTGDMLVVYIDISHISSAAMASLEKKGFAKRFKKFGSVFWGYITKRAIDFIEQNKI